MTGLRILFTLALLGLALSFAWSQEEPAVYPDEAFSRPAVDKLSVFQTQERLSIAYGVEARAQHYATNEMQLVEEAGQPVTQWRITPKDLDVAALGIGGKIRQLPESIAFTVRNDSATAVGFLMTADEMNWLPVRETTYRSWLLGDAQMVEPGETRQLVYSLASATSASEDKSPPRLPFGSLSIHLRFLVPGQAHILTLSDFEVRYPEGQVTPTSRLSLELCRADWVYWRKFLSPEEATDPQAVLAKVKATDLPWWIPGGDYELGLVSDGYRVPGSASAITVPTRPGAELPLAERRLYGGRPSFFVEGKPFSWNGYSSYDYQPGNVTEFGEHGATVLCVPASAGAHVHGISAQNWLAPDVFDFGELDQQVAFSLQANPDAILFLRLSLNLPPWWSQAHPDDLVRVRTAQGDLFWEETGFFKGASLASKAWLADQESALRALLSYCKRQPWASRLAGIWLTGEVTEEWFAWGSNDGYYSDYSGPSQQAFADWLAQQPYSATLPTQSLPNPDQRKASGYDVYPATESGRQAASYHRYLSELTAATISHFARIVKDETAGKPLVGVFYGYVIQLAGEPRQAISGHFGLRELLDNPDIDFLGSVPLLNWRDLSWGYNPYCSATDSIQAAGKLFCSENDLFSWLHPILWHSLYDPADPRGGAISMHRRECAGDAVRGVMSQKFSLMTSWHHDAALQQDFAFQQKVLASTLDLDKTGVEEIAFVVDDTTFGWTPPESTLLRFTNAELLRAFGRTGAPVGVWLLSDLDKLPDRIKLVVIASATAAKEADLAKLSALLEAGGRTVLVVGLPGLVNTETQQWEVQRPGQLLGLPITVRDEALPGTLTTVEGLVVVLPNLRPRGETSEPGKFAYADGASAWAERALPNGGKLLWCGAPPASWDFARPLVEAAGVHCYAPVGCFVHASRELVAVTSNIGQTVELVFPSPVSVTDLFDGWKGEGQAITSPFVLGQTRLLKVEPVE